MPGFYDYCWYYLIFSFIGWVIESIFVSLQQKKFVNRGFLTGPVCPIYGTAMVIIIFALSGARMLLFPDGGITVLGVLLLLVVSTVIACAVEYFVGWLLEVMFHQRWWDYSDHGFNINGRIAIPESLAWGPLATIFMLFLLPWFDSLIAKIPFPIGCAVLAVIAVLILVDATLILYKMNTFDRLAASMKKGLEEIRAKRAEDAAEFRRRTEELRAKLEHSRRRYSERRIKREKRLRYRLSQAYPKLGERWRILRDSRERDEKDED